MVETQVEMVELQEKIKVSNNFLSPKEAVEEQIKSIMIEAFPTARALLRLI